VKVSAEDGVEGDAAEHEGAVVAEQGVVAGAAVAIGRAGRLDEAPRVERSLAPAAAGWRGPIDLAELLGGWISADLDLGRVDAVGHARTELETVRAAAIASVRSSPKLYIRILRSLSAS
jgi:hypothetical protein